jgi:hypothetical protein
MISDITCFSLKFLILFVECSLNHISFFVADKVKMSPVYGNRQVSFVKSKNLRVINGSFAVPDIQVS